jgi:hypothetical protein
MYRYICHLAPALFCASVPCFYARSNSQIDSLIGRSHSAPARYTCPPRQDRSAPAHPIPGQNQPSHRSIDSLWKCLESATSKKSIVTKAMISGRSLPSGNYSIHVSRYFSRNSNPINKTAKISRCSFEHPGSLPAGRARTRSSRLPCANTEGRQSTAKRGTGSAPSQ